MSELLKENGLPELPIFMKCPKCNNTQNFKILYTFDEELSHNHLECPNCGYNFNQWVNVSKEKLKDIFGPNWEKYQ